MFKKVLFIITQSEFGGAQHFLAHFTTALDKNKYDILVGAGFEGDNEKGLLRFLEKKGINTKHLKYLRRSINPFFDFLGLLEIRKLIKKEKPDTIFLCSSKAGVLGSLAARLYRSRKTQIITQKDAENIRVNLRNYPRVSAAPKVIYRVGGWAFNDPLPRWKKVFYKFIEKFSAKWKDIIIFNSEHDRKQAIKLKIKPKKEILTIYNGIDIDNLEFLSKEEAREELINLISNYSNHSNQILSPNDQLIGCIANLYPAKGLEYLIEAAKLSLAKVSSADQQIKFIVIGEGRERKKLENLIKKHNLGKNFFLVGAIPDAYKYLKAFDIFVLSSVKEGFPWTILEAMAAEVPIIATKVGGVPEIIENPSTDSTNSLQAGSGQAGIIVEPRNSKQLAEAIQKLIGDPNLREKFSQEAKNLVREKFSLNKMVKKTEELL